MKDVRKLDLEKDFPNYKKKLVVQHLPHNIQEQQILEYFYEILSSVSHVQYAWCPILSVEIYKELGFVTLEFKKRDDADVILDLDGTKYHET